MLAAPVASSSNNQKDKINPQEVTWESFKSKRTNVDLYTENSVVVFVPTSVGARGNSNIRRFFLNSHFNEKNVSVQETVYNTIAANNKLFEESVWTIKFIQPECNWLVPQLDERYLTNATIQIIVNTSVSFDSESSKISSIRFSWDQASVLKQLKVISDKVSWPVTGERQTESLTSLATAQLKDLNGELIRVDIEKPSKQVPPQFTPGRVFGPVDPKDLVKDSVRRPEPNAPPSRNIFTYEPPPARPLVAPSNKLKSSFTFGHDDGGNSLPTRTSKSTSTQSFSSAPPAGKPTPRVNRSIIG